jgi:hypothetical protein
MLIGMEWYSIWYIYYNILYFNLYILTVYIYNIYIYIYIYSSTVPTLYQCTPTALVHLVHQGTPGTPVHQGTPGRNYTWYTRYTRYTKYTYTTTMYNADIC